MQVDCPHCGAVFSASTRAAGKRLPCPECGERVRVASPEPRAREQGPSAVGWGFGLIVGMVAACAFLLLLCCGGLGVLLSAGAAAGK